MSTRSSSLGHLSPLAVYALIGMLLLYSQFIHAHKPVNATHIDQNNPRAVKELDWHAAHIKRVVTAGYPVTFGIYAFTHRKPHRFVERFDERGKKRRCIEANFLSFDIDDAYAFDIEEDVEIAVLIDGHQNSSLVYGYDKHGSANASGELNRVQVNGPNKASRLIWQNIRLNRARFVNRGLSGTDFALATKETMLPEAELNSDAQTSFVLCDIKITRPQVREIDTGHGVKAQFRFLNDNTGEITPVRFGLYDAKGSAVLFNQASLPVKYYEEEKRHLSLSAFYPPYQFWPHDNRYFYYTNGELEKMLSPGSYTLIATKGPEYGIAKTEFVVGEEDSTPVNIEVNMTRWRDLPSMGWYSGDVHIHMQRQQKDNKNIFQVLAAEDIHFSNLLIMSNHSGSYYGQYAWGEEGQYTDGDHAVIPGVEGPRTAHRGHAIALNVSQPKHNQEDYFLYHNHLKFYQKQEAVTGYAHVGSGEFNASWGLALDVPLGLVDFVEIMQASRLRTKLWYQFLNLGYKLAPAAGSDFPYFDQPGAVRSFVNINDKAGQGMPTDLGAWYQQLKKGETFVSNAPLIELSVNGAGPGASLQTEQNTELDIKAKVTINPDFDSLENLELVYCGRVIKKVKAKAPDGAAALTLNYQMPANTQGWLALRAKGKNYALAHTGAIYLENRQGESFCTRQAMADVETMLERLNTFKHAQIDVEKELEYWDSKTLKQSYLKQRKQVVKQIAKVTKRYLYLKEKLLIAEKDSQ